MAKRLQAEQKRTHSRGDNFEVIYSRGDNFEVTTKSGSGYTAVAPARRRRRRGGGIGGGEGGLPYPKQP